MTKKKHRNLSLEVLAFPDASLSNERAHERVMAHMAVNPIHNSAVLVAEICEPNNGDIDLTECILALRKKAEKVNQNDLGEVEAMLAAQLHALDTIFVWMARKSYHAEYADNLERYMRLALKAQGQCRATAEALAAIKNPPVVIAKQANITNGPQQVNNGILPTRTEKPEPVQSKLLEESHEQRMDTGAALAASSSNPALASVEPIHRPAHRKRKGKSRP